MNISISVAWLNLLLIIISECHGRQQITQAGRPAGMESETSTTRTSFAYFVAHINCEWIRANSKQRNTHTHRLLYSQSIASQVNFRRADWPPQDMDGNTKNVRRINARSPQRWSAHKDDGNSEYASWNWIVGNQCQHTGMEIFSLSLYVSFRFLHSLHRQNHKSKTRTRETKKIWYEDGEGVSNWSISRLIATCAKFTCCTVIYASKCTCFCDVFSLEATTKDNFNTKILSLKPFLFIYLCAKHHNVTK